MRLARPGSIELVDFQRPGALDRFPGVSYDECMKAMHLVTPDGHVYKGFEAVARALATRRILGLIAYVYFVPGIRQLLDVLYRAIAANRYRLGGKKASEACKDGACSLHARPQELRKK